MRTKTPTVRQKKRRPAVAKTTSDQDGHCIGCGEARAFDAAKPLCTKCYMQSKRGADLEQLQARSCHRCGTLHEATLARPICYKCFKQLPAETQSELKNLLN